MPVVSTFTARKHSHGKGEAGVTFVEILITILLVAIGFLAAAQMQIQGSRFNQSAYHTSQADFMIGAMLDRMRTNRDGLRDGAYSGVATGQNAVDPQCDSKECTSTQLAQQDIYDWSSMLYNLQSDSNFQPLLPSSESGINARGEIVESEPGVYTVSMYWAEKIDDTDTEQSLSIKFAP